MIVDTVIDQLYLDTYGNMKPRVHKDNYKLMDRSYVYCMDCDCYSVAVNQVIKRHINSNKHKLNVFLTEWLEYKKNEPKVFWVVDDWDDKVPKRILKIGDSQI
jgi:hypothetical protein